MINKSQIQEAIFRAIDKVNEVSLHENLVLKDEAAVLIGEAAQLDSMGFVNFVVALDEATTEEFGISINVAEEINARGSAAPEMMTVSCMTDFLLPLIQGRIGTKG